MREHEKTAYFDVKQSGICSAASVIHSDLAADTAFVQSMCSNNRDKQTQNHMEEKIINNTEGKSSPREKGFYCIGLLH